MTVLLESIPIFRSLSPSHIAIISQNLTTIQKKKLQPIVVKGESVAGIYIVAAGKVGVYAGANQTPLAILGARECFGEMSLLEGTTASATVRAEEDQTTLWVLRRALLDMLCAEDRTFASALYQGLAKALSNKLRAITIQVNEQRSEVTEAAHGLKPKMIIDTVVTDLEDLGSNYGKRLEELTSTEPVELRMLISRLGKAPKELKRVQDFLNSLNGLEH